MKVIWYNQSLKDVSELATLDVLSKVLKSLNLVDLGTKGKLFKIYFFQIKVLKPSGPSVFNFTISESTLRKKNYSISCQENQTRTIPSSRKRNEVGSTNEVGSNLGVKIAKALWNCCTKKSFTMSTQPMFQKIQKYLQRIHYLSQTSFRFC